MQKRLFDLMKMDEEGGGGGGGETEPKPVPTEDIEKLKADLAKAQKAINDLTAENADKKRLIKEKMTAEELKDAELQEKAKKLQDLQDQIEQSTLAANKAIVEAIASSVKTDADVKDGDAEFSAFIGAITSSDKDNSTKLAQYFSKVVKSAYEKGVADTKRDAVQGTGGDTKVGGGTGGSENDFKKFQESRPKAQTHVELK